MKYIVYQTTNKVNKKIYIGVHETENPDKFDGYIGCGAYINKPSSYNKGKTHLHNAILKYGISQFIRTTIKVFDNLEDALDLECWLVDEEFVKRTDTYNMIIGGGYPPFFGNGDNLGPLGTKQSVNSPANIFKLSPTSPFIPRFPDKNS